MALEGGDGHDLRGATVALGGQRHPPVHISRLAKNHASQLVIRPCKRRRVICCRTTTFTSGTRDKTWSSYCRITVPLPSITKMYLKQVTALGINICLHLLHHCSYLLIISNNSTNMCRHVLKHGRHRQQQQRFFQGQVIYIVVLLSLALALALDRSLLRI